jgi:hypothetical protein
MLLAGCTPSDEKPIRVNEFNRGVVVSVTGCDKSKYSLYCLVETTAWRKRLDITDYPGEYVTIGDTLSWRNVYYEGRREQHMCRNDRCWSLSTCYSWMPCYD